ncbi:ATP-binding protein, partial [Nocardia terrae]|uniref:ATP-binding protein n=1 Tax=Nocardia terrae TaxID=2675851 RepID=UPI001F277D9B
LRPGEEKLVFNRFWRSDPSRMRRSGGTGLGLSISVEDANLHEGKLEAWGEIGVGASFRLTLPLVRGKKLGISPLSLEPPKIRGTVSPEQLALDIASSDATPEAIASAAAVLESVPVATEPEPAATESEDGTPAVESPNGEAGFEAIAPEFPSASAADGQS